MFVNIAFHTVAACKGRISLGCERASKHVRCQTNKLKTHPSLGNKTKGKKKKKKFCTGFPGTFLSSLLQIPCNKKNICCYLTYNNGFFFPQNVMCARYNFFISFRIRPRLFPLPYRRQLRIIWISPRSMVKNWCGPTSIRAFPIDYSITYSLAIRVGKRNTFLMTLDCFIMFHQNGYCIPCLGSGH